MKSLFSYYCAEKEEIEEQLLLDVEWCWNWLNIFQVIAFLE